MVIIENYKRTTIARLHFVGFVLLGWPEPSWMARTFLAVKCKPSLSMMCPIYLIRHRRNNHLDRFNFKPDFFSFSRTASVNAYAGSTRDANAINVY